MKGSAVHLKRSTQSGGSSRPADLALLFELDLPGRAERPELSGECQWWGGPIPRLCDFLRTVAAVWNCSPLPLRNTCAFRSADLSFGTCGCLPGIEHIFHSAYKFRRKKRLFQNGCADLDQVTQFGKFVSKASDKQELRLGVSGTNSL